MADFQGGRNTRDEVAASQGKSGGQLMRYDTSEDESHCQCINCRLARMEKQISLMQNKFEEIIENGVRQSTKS